MPRDQKHNGTITENKHPAIGITSCRPPHSHTPVEKLEFKSHVVCENTVSKEAEQLRPDTMP